MRAFRYFNILILFCLAALPSFAQTTAVSGQVKDVNGVAYAGATLKAQLVLAGAGVNGQPTVTVNNAQQCRSAGQGSAPCQVPFQGTNGPITLDNTGSFSLTLQDNSLVTPAGTQWLFSITSPGSPPPLGTGPQSCFGTLTITGASQSISASFSACPALSNVTGGGGSGTPVPGVFNANFDPPLFQCYSSSGGTQVTGCATGALTTAGTQAGIGLNGTPIDTQQISWRPIGFSVSITEPFTYINGADLHVLNANWVNQTGTFQVQAANQSISPYVIPTAYGASASSFAYRSDGPTAQAAEWAEETVVEANPSGTQNHGPCVIMQTATESGYCIQAATDILKIVILNSGSVTVLQASCGSAPVTGDTIALQGAGTSPKTLTLFHNQVAVCSTTDSTFNTGNTGMFSAANATSNGATAFRSGTGPYPQCLIALDSSVDGVTWTAGGAIPGQSCQTAGSQQVYTTANFVRVNLQQFNSTASTSLNVVYAGRLAPASSNVGINPAANGQPVVAGDVVWFQITSQGVGPVAVQSWVSILQPNGTTLNSGPLTVNSCATGGPGVPGQLNTPTGVGYGYIIPVTGLLQSAITQINTGQFAQGTFYINQYVMTKMPSNSGVIGTTNSCTGALASNNPNKILLSSAPVGSFYPMGFTGTTLNYISPWSIPGYNSKITITNPAAGADFTFTSSTTNNENPRLCIVGVSYTITASATVQNRFTSLQIQQGSGPILYYISNIAQTNGQVVNYSFSPGAAEVSQVLSGTTVFHSIPFNNGQDVCADAGLAGNFTVKSLTGGLAAGDQLSNIQIWTRVQQDGN